GSAISSPSARFLQWRAKLARQGSGSGPTLQAVSVAYLQTNLAPVLKRISIEPPGLLRTPLSYGPEPDLQDLAFTGIRVNPDTGDLSSPPTQGPEKRMYMRGMRSLAWEAEDANGDAMSFDLSFRGEGETAWKPLARGLRENYFGFDSTQLPDG